MRSHKFADESNCSLDSIVMFNKASAITNSQKPSMDNQFNGPSNSALPDQEGHSVSWTSKANGFINKPSKGWLHSDEKLRNEGVVYSVRYIGCLDVNTSIKSLNFETRSIIAEECVNQVCQAANLKICGKKRQVDARVNDMLGKKPYVERCENNVQLVVTTTCIRLIGHEKSNIIAKHDLPNISFASGGDEVLMNMMGYVAYVAKDSIVGRACFVLECGLDLAQDVISTIGQAFELRYFEYLKKILVPVKLQDEDREYYNDLPGKVPPDLLDCQDRNENQDRSKFRPNRPIPQSLALPLMDKAESNENLIDFEAPTPPACGPSKSTELGLFNSDQNDSSIATAKSDPFDMHNFEMPLGGTTSLSKEEQQTELEKEKWYHGSICRVQAENLLQEDGDFLVRDYIKKPGQYVLTVKSEIPRHLLLIDENGVGGYIPTMRVTMKDRKFKSVSHLVQFHLNKRHPIVFGENEILISNPVTIG